MLFKKLLVFTVILTVAATGTILPAQAQTEMDALVDNLTLLCEESFEDLEEMGLSLNDDEAEALDFACGVVIDGVDDEEVSDENFVAAIDLLEDLLLEFQAQPDAEMDALVNNLTLLCEESFEDLEEMGLSLNDDEAEALDFACDVVVDGVDDEEVSDEDFVAAIDLLEEILIEVTY